MWLVAMTVGALSPEGVSVWVWLVLFAISVALVAFLGSRMFSSSVGKATAIAAQFGAWLAAHAVGLAISLGLLWASSQPDLWVADSETAKVASQHVAAVPSVGAGIAYTIAHGLIVWLLPVVIILALNGVWAVRAPQSPSA
jgi:hypothetical protein